MCLAMPMKISKIDGSLAQCEAGGRQGEAETVTVHAQRFQEDLSPCRTPAAGSDVYAVHQR